MDVEPLGERTTTQLVPIAAVLYEPNEILLDKLFLAMAIPGRQLYIFVNGQLTQYVEKRLSQLASCTILRSSSNIGLGAALNAIMERATSDGASYLLLLDQDSTPAPDLPDALLRALQSRAHSVLPLAVIGPLLVSPSGENYKAIRYAWRNLKHSTAHFIPTSGSLISIAAWRDVGPFRADYFIDGIDVEWGFRAWSRGYGSLVVRDIELEHRWGIPADETSSHTFQILRQSDLRNYYYIRNSIDCLQLRHFPVTWKVRKMISLMFQITILLHVRNYNSRIRNIVRSAISSGLGGDLGPVVIPPPANGV